MKGTDVTLEDLERTKSSDIDDISVSTLGMEGFDDERGGENPEDATS